MVVTCILPVILISCSLAAKSLKTIVTLLPSIFCTCFAVTVTTKTSNVLMRNVMGGGGGINTQVGRFIGIHDYSQYHPALLIKHLGNLHFSIITICATNAI